MSMDKRQMQVSMATMRTRLAQGGEPTHGFLDGQMLLAMPGMPDERFSRTVIYLCAHSAEGAMGIVINKPAADLNFPDLLVQLEIIPEADRIRLPHRVGRQLAGRIRSQLVARDVDVHQRESAEERKREHR